VGGEWMCAVMVDEWVWIVDVDVDGCEAMRMLFFILIFWMLGDCGWRMAIASAAARCCVL